MYSRIEIEQYLSDIKILLLKEDFKLKEIRIEKPIRIYS